MSQTKLQSARELIQEHNYTAARAVLETMPDDPTARRWLRRLNKQERPVAPIVQAAPRRSNTWTWVLGVLVIVGLIGVIGYATWLENTQSAEQAHRYVCTLQYTVYSDAWSNCIADR